MSEYEGLMEIAAAIRDLNDTAKAIREDIKQIRCEISSVATSAHDLSELRHRQHAHNAQL